MSGIETDGSFWFFDEARKTYVRTPKSEKPRDAKHQSPPGLKDLTPHPYVDYRACDHFLLILCDTGDQPKVVYAPIGGGGYRAEAKAAMRDLLAANR